MAVLMVFGGSQLALTIIDLRDKKALLVPLVLSGMTLACNLAVGFVVGIALADALRSKPLLADAMRYAPCASRNLLISSPNSSLSSS
jgi:hypothetical protein